MSEQNVEVFDTSAMEQPSIAEKIADIAREQESNTPPEIREADAQIEESVEATPEPEQEIVEEVVEEVVEQTEEVPAEEVEAEEKYNPDYSFRVYDEEKEFDDFIKPYVNKDNEEKIRDLYTRAHGIEGIKKKLDGSRQELAVTKTEMNQVVNELSYLGTCIKQDNLDEVFKSLNINQDKLEQWMVKKLQMTPEQREDNDRRIEATRRASTIENQYHELNEKYNQIITSQTINEIESSLSEPGVKAFVNQLNERLAPIDGENGFMKEVGRIGVDFYEKNKYDLPVHEVVSLALKKFGYADQVQPQSPTIKRAAVKPVTKVVVNNKNTIPSVGSGTPSSPAGKTFTSIEDLVAEGKRLRKEGK